MLIRSISTPQQWQALANRWNLLTRGNPFRGWDWLSTWWKHYGIWGELAVVAAFDDHENLVGAAPWYIEQIASRGRILRMIGTGEACSDYPTLLCTPEFEDQVAAAIALWLTGEFQTRWDLLEMECVPGNDSASRKLIENLEQAGCSVMTSPGPNLWNIDLPTNWPEYLAQLSKSHRKQINRLIRNYCDTGRAKIVFAQDEAQLEWAMALLVDLHQRRWRLAGKAGVFASQRFSDFLHDVALRLLATQALNLCVLELDGQPAAVDFHLLNSAANFVYQGGIEPEFAEDSPGKLLTALLIKEAIETGRISFDFLRGDEAYKPHFRALPSETVNLQVVPNRAAAQFRHGLWMTGLAMKNLVKSGLSLTGMH